RSYLEQHQIRRSDLGFVWRLGLDHHRVREDRPVSTDHGTRPEVLRCDHPSLGILHRATCEARTGRINLCRDRRAAKGHSLMQGRRPKPTHLKLLQGNPGKRPYNANEPKPAPQVPSPPEHLTEVALKEWNRLAELLGRIGLLTAIDRTAFAAYC